MNINASCKFDYKSIKALTHLSTYRKSDPKKRMLSFLITFAVLSVIIVAEIILIAPDPFLFYLLAIAVVCLLIDLYVYFIIPKISFAAMKNMQNTENEYIFSDNSVKITSKSSEYNGEANIEYTLFVKVYETSEYLFIYQTKNQAFIVDKSTVTGGTAEEIRERLSSCLGKKYIICKY